MADIGRLRKRRSANKNVLLGLIVKAKDYMKDDFDENNKQDAMRELSRF